MVFCVGLTGGIGCGKSRAADLFSELGVTVERGITLDGATTLTYVEQGVPVPFLTGTRLSLCLGYVALPFAYEFSGPTFGLRWETKSVSRVVAD